MTATITTADNTAERENDVLVGKLPLSADAIPCNDAAMVSLRSGKALGRCQPKSGHHFTHCMGVNVL